MDEPRFRDCARYWRSPLLPGADMLTAQYREHEFSPHWHEAYTVPVIEAGAEMYAYQGAQRVAEAGTVPLINPGEIHTGARAMDVGWRYRVFYLPVDFMAQLACDITSAPQRLPWFAADVIRDPDLAARISYAHRLLEAWSESSASGLPGGGDPLAAETALIDAVSTLITRHALGNPRAARPGADPPRVARMKERLAADLIAPVSLSELAAEVGLSAFHAARLFTQATRMPPHAWRTQLRLQRALGPLREGATVADVAAACGFTDQSHFTRHFRRMFGVPPGRWQAGNEGAG